MEKLTIFYDGACHLCAREIDHYKKVDIAKKSFDFSNYGIPKKKMHKYFHIRDQNLKIHTGVEAFYLIWRELNIFIFLQKCYELKPLRAMMKIGYQFFAQMRPLLPKREKCSDGICYR